MDIGAAAELSGEGVDWLMLDRVRYRIWQVWKAVTGRLTPGDWEVVNQVLNAEQMELFRRMSDAEQTHGVRVLQDLMGGGFRDPDLLVAALLHDVGKSRYPLSLWERVWIVIKPHVYGRFSGDRQEYSSPQSHPLRVSEKHPSWGAEMALGAGASETAAWLIENHERQNLQALENSQRTRLLRALLEADDRN